MFSEFKTDRRQCVPVDGCFSSFSPVIFGVLGPPLIIIYTFDIWLAIESSKVAYADNTPKYAVIPSPQDRQRITSCSHS